MTYCGKISTLQLTVVIAWLTTILVLTTSAAEAPEEELIERISLHGVEMSLQRPGADWTTSRDTTKPPIVLSIASPDSAVKISVQVIDVPGITLQMLKPMILGSISSQVKDFEKLTDTARKIDAIDVFEVSYSGIHEGVHYRSVMLLIKPGDYAFAVKGSVPSDSYEDYGIVLNQVVAGVRLVVDQN